MKFFKLPPRIATFGLASYLMLSTTHVLAEDLMDFWKSAMTREPSYVASKFEQLAGERRKEQADSVWRPNVFLNAGLGYLNSSSSTAGAYFSTPGGMVSTDAIFNTSINNGVLSRYALTAVQPLYDQERSANRKQLLLSSNIADLSWLQAQQNLILLVSERYFDFLKAKEALRLAKKQEQAISTMYAEIRKRNELGDASQTDLQEALQKMEQTRVGVSNAEMDLKNKQMALIDLMPEARNMKSLNTMMSIQSKHLNSLESYLGLMKKQNIQLKIVQLNQDSIKAEMSKFTLAGSPKVELFARSAKDRITGSGDYGAVADNTMTSNSVGVQLSVPLYTGGYRSAKQEELLLNLDKAKAEYDRSSIDMERNLRSIWLYLDSAGPRINSLNASYQAAKSRLNSTRQGHRAGSRTTLELLGAEIDAVNTEYSVYSERINLLMNRIRLDSIVGNLGEEQLHAINAYLK